MAPSDTPDPLCILAVLLAGGEGTRLHELSGIEAKPALPVAGRRLADFAVARAVAAGLPRLTVALGPRPETLARHLRETWGGATALCFRDGARRDAPAVTPSTTLTLSRCLEGESADEVLVLPADQVHALDLRDLLAAHRAGGRPATLATPGGGHGGAHGAPEAPGPCVLGWPALRKAVLGAAAEGRDLWADLLPALAARGDLALWQAPEGAYWRDIDTLDDLRAVSLDFQRGTPVFLPPGDEAGPLGDEEGRALALEIGGLRLSAPRFGARQRGRWTLIEDSVVMPGARVAPGARLSRTIVAPGAVVPANLTLGEDPAEDARWFRVTPGGTTLVTAPMLSHRAAELMRARFGGRFPDLAIPKTR